MNSLAIARKPLLEQEPEEEKDSEEVIRGSGVIFLGKFGRISKSLYQVLVARLVGADIFGLYTLGWSLIELVGRFGLFGLDRGVVQFVSGRPGDGQARARTIGQALALGGIAGLVVTALVWAVAPWAAASVFHKPELSPILRVLALTIPLMVVSSILLAGLRALRIVKYDVYVRSLAEPLVLLVSAVGICALGWTASGLAFAYLIAAASGVGLAVRFFRRHFSLSRCAAGMTADPLRSPLVAFSAPIPFDDALYNLMSRLGLFVLAMFLPAASVGVYAATSEAAGVVRNIRQAVDPIFTPVATGLIQTGNRERLSDLFASVCRWILILELAFLIGVGLWGGAILSVFGPGFAAGAWSLMLLSVGFAVNGAFGPAEMLLMGAGRTGLNLLNTVSLLAVNLGLNLFLVPRHGIVGAALATAVSMVLINLLRVAQARAILGVHPFRRALLKPVCAAGIAFGAGRFLVGLDAPWSSLSALALPLYFGLVTVFGLEAEDRALWEKFRGRMFRSRRPDIQSAPYAHADAAD